MTLAVVAFYAFAVLLIGAAVQVVLGKNLFHAVLWLALALVSTAGIFITLNAEFIAAVQVLLYAGGVITVVVFAIVVTERLVGERLSQTSRHVAAGGVVSAGVLVLLVRAIGQAQLAPPLPPAPPELTRQIGTSLLTRFVLPFELLAVLLLVGLLAASYFARPEE
jgi:NADH:ubiquinone oxidoreductase subunit 6 (subunit J)